MKQRMAIGHNAMLAPVPNWDLPTLAGAGALRSCANDMLKFLEAFLGYTESPLAPAMKAMLEVRRPAGQTEIGLGWLIYSTDGREIAWHNGGTGASGRLPDTILKRVSGSLSSLMLLLWAVSMTSVSIS